LFGGTPIEQDEPELSASFYAERNPAEQAQPHPYQSFVFKDYQSPVNFDIKPNPVGPIMATIPMAQTQVVADKAKEYSMNKPTPFTGDRTKIRQFLQDCLGYLDMNQGIYNTDRLKIGFILSYMNDGEAANWKEYYLNTLEDPNTGMPNFPTLVTFLADVRKAFRAANRVHDTVNRLETLRQGKKTAEELNTEFLQIVGQAGMDRKTPSDHLHLIAYYRKTLEPRLSRRILFSDDVPKTIDGWMEKAIQYDTNWRMGNLFLNHGNPSKKKADTNKSNGNAHWWRTNEKRDPNAMDVDALTMEEREMLMRQGKCFRCKKVGHMAKDCPSEQGESSKKKVDPARFAYTMIKALTKEQRESFTKMVMEDKDGEDF
jgi:Ty3 transposon capsid-like protein/Zinc knuckle